MLQALLAVSAQARENRQRRDILPGDPRYNGPHHHAHHHEHQELSKYLPPQEVKQSIELPSTSYGVPFKQQV